MMMSSEWNRETMLSSVVLGVLLSLLILLTVGGNVLVCLAVCASRRLRCLTNCFIVSLAATDLLLGLLVLPFSALLQLSDEWPLGPAFCNFYISMDVMLCTASILTLLVISVDRYVAVTMPLRYASLVLPWRVAVAMAGVWTVSVAVSFLPIQMGWNTINGTVQNRGPGSRERECRFELNGPYVLTDSLLTFYLPLIVMCWTYFRILVIARTQAKRIISTRPTCIASYDCRGTSPSATNTLVSSVSAATLREHKAAVTLAALIGAFVVCWLPYFILFTALGLKGHPDPSSVPEYSIVLWLGYANSALNPILYGALNKDFRSAYTRLLRCRCPSYSGCSCRPSPNLPAGNAAGEKKVTRLLRNRLAVGRFLTRHCRNSCENIRFPSAFIHLISFFLSPVSSKRGVYWDGAAVRAHPVHVHSGTSRSNGYPAKWRSQMTPRQQTQAATKGKSIRTLKLFKCGSFSLFTFAYRVPLSHRITKAIASHKRGETSTSCLCAQITLGLCCWGGWRTKTLSAQQEDTDTQAATLKKVFGVSPCHYICTQAIVLVSWRLWKCFFPV